MEVDLEKQVAKGYQVIKEMIKDHEWNYNYHMRQASEWGEKLAVLNATRDTLFKDEVRAEKELENKTQAQT